MKYEKKFHLNGKIFHLNLNDLFYKKKNIYIFGCPFNIDKNKILTPEVKIKIDQVNKINKVWPMSGWINNKPEIKNVIRKENVYFKVNIKWIYNINKGFFLKLHFGIFIHLDMKKI